MRSNAKTDEILNVMATDTHADQTDQLDREGRIAYAVGLVITLVLTLTMLVLGPYLQ